MIEFKMVAIPQDMVKKYSHNYLNLFYTIACCNKTFKKKLVFHC